MSNTNADATLSTTSSFVTSLVANTAIAGGEFVAFILFRRFIKAIYEPRTYIPPKDIQALVLGNHLLWPIWRIIQADPEEILKKNGVDPYMFVRFLIMMSKAMVPIWLLSWAILLPVDAANSDVDHKSGLDRLTFGNVAKNKQSRYWAHLILDYCFIFWILYLIWVEMDHWLIVRQKHLINPAHSKLPQANTVLVTGIPKNFLDEEKLEQLFAHLPGGVKRIWLTRNLKEMPDLWERRTKASAKLESAQVKLIKLARQHRIDTEKKRGKLEAKQKPVSEQLTGPINPQLIQTPESHSEETMPSDPKALGLADQLVPRSLRPTMRLKPGWAPFGLGWLGIGQTVDKIDWARREIASCTQGLEKSRVQLQKDIDTPGIGEETYPPLTSAFIHFNQQVAAHIAAQCLAHHQPYRMNKRYIEQSPANVIWRNLSLNPYEQNVRQALSYAMTGGLILLWTFPELAAFEGIPSKTNVELDLMTRYFIFLVVHTFFVVTLASGLISSVKPLAENPSSVATILAQQMPTASTFFITLTLTQFTGVVGTLLQAITLLLYYVKVILLGGSPRSVYQSRYKLQTASWGTTFPGVTVYAVIMIAYCVISPVINGFGAAFFVLSALVYKYLFIWVYDQPPESDTGGVFFPKAIAHVFVGMYIQEICLCALFFLARDVDDKVSAIPQGVLMIILIVCTAGAHYLIIVSYAPLIHSLPLSLSHLSYGMPREVGHDGSSVGENDNDRATVADSSREHLTGKPKPSFPASSSTSSPAQQHRQLPLETDSIPTSASPPVKSPSDVEMGQIGQPPDPEGDGNQEEPYFAVPGGPGIQQRQQEDGNDPNAFFHPATKEPQRILWLPRDELGLCEAEIEANASAGVESTHRYAILNSKGKVQIFGPPPDTL